MLSCEHDSLRDVVNQNDDVTRSHDTLLGNADIVQMIKMIKLNLRRVM